MVSRAASSRWAVTTTSETAFAARGGPKRAVCAPGRPRRKQASAASESRAAKTTRHGPHAALLGGPRARIAMRGFPDPSGKFPECVNSTSLMRMHARFAACRCAPASWGLRPGLVPERPAGLLAAGVAGAPDACARSCPPRCKAALSRSAAPMRTCRAPTIRARPRAAGRAPSTATATSARGCWTGRGACIAPRAPTDPAASAPAWFVDAVRLRSRPGAAPRPGTAAGPAWWCWTRCSAPDVAAAWREFGARRGVPAGHRRPGPGAWRGWRSAAALRPVRRLSAALQPHRRGRLRGPRRRGGPRRAASPLPARVNEMADAAGRHARAQPPAGGPAR